MAPLHIAVLGAGPIGLEMAAGAVRRGHRVSVFERGAEVAANVKSWGHVRLFSSNALNHSADGSALLREAGVALPAEDAFPTGAEYAAGYLEPLAAAILKSGLAEITCGCEVLSVGRGTLSKGQSIGACEVRIAAPFELLVLQGDEERVVEVGALVDASGTYGNPNWLGKGGRPAVGERELRADGTIRYTLPSAGVDAAELLAGGTVAVVGSGASAITTLHMLRQQCTEVAECSCRVVWITRRADAPYELVDNDPLPQRAALYTLGNDFATADGTAAADGFQVDHRGGCNVVSLKCTEDSAITIELERAEGGARLSVTVNSVIAHVGYRPDTQLTSELQVHYCYASEGPMKLAAAMMAAGGGGGDCLAQISPGPATMLNPEPGFFVIGMKSFGRGSAFLLRIGHEQVQHVLSLLGPAAL